ncbi:hypothetical protein P296_16980 [Salmonella enterica subsp. arizonae serovar 18:z4,z23:- str. CVM N26624]|uniref:Uncharacterized protein n=1 Tax=Salmonella enterica subsp. arizonae serovar 18:z4,z23:- str. CVM N26626 TaxID=1395119 RepID=A0A3S5YIW3_SALER|nr:hypothetical protein N898_03145 [Salmonella enterica subsp. arizonae serovar 62:z36:- str. RKS2983]OLV92271.1 hypothetical protein P297_10025 [Salmonella enterica subsp. arizonae serovar 18:z4,z23:- str. CVM N26625]OLV97682.1 hypothetical protein P296_16980 [Salmonella enterica subsp. arizonae serovar 18:z4,z23:- str. CVM N26624]OLV97924.1 hypothetical protein P298_17475 [Salmonella enterica subsp. arizonae serovar 18:z4,z23:- str. CVM N26626]OLW07939.1 hypothetical protein P292_07590 [Salmo
MLAVVMMTHFIREDTQYLQSLLLDDVDSRNH